MAKEIERKFLVVGDAWRQGARSKRYRQGYVFSSEAKTVRVRVAGDRGFLTLKGPSEGASRDEYEYEIPLADAEAMLDALCDKPLIEKTRHVVDFGGLTWEVDEFSGDNAGLIVAEVELEREDQPVPLPPWAGREVTGDARYFNASLAKQPFSRW